MFVKLIEDQEFVFDSLASATSIVLRQIRALDISRFSKASQVVRVGAQTFTSTHP
ncbi:MAG: hypothetical protein FJ100_05120 [Deltaproteobacteria bacterium]|nr:hypothetical protein [Deltaproteobacteria bacterium]